MKKARLSRSVSSRSTKAGLMLAAAAASFAFNRYAAAITGTWLDTDLNSNWSDGNNWSTNPTPPGSDLAGSTTNGDTALFNNSTASNTVNLDVGNWNILNITFDTANANSFLIGSTAVGANSLVLSSGGEILETSAVSSPASELINAPVVLEGNYTFENDSPTTTSGLKFNGDLSGGVSGPITLTLQGTNIGGSSSSSDELIGAISNGLSSALNIVKSESGTWELASTGTSTYTGTTTVNAGILNVATVGGISAATDVTVNNVASEFLSSVATGPFPTVHSVTLNCLNGTANTQLGEASGGSLNIANNSGPALVINDQSASNTGTPVAVNVDLTGTGGIISLENTAYATHYSWSKNLDLGTTSHLLYVTAGTSSTDLQINGVISGDSAGGGMIKSGNGIIKLQQTSVEGETFTGPIEIQEGSLKQIGNGTSDIFSGVNTLLIDGGNFNLDGNGTAGNATFGAVVMTSGSISTASSSAFNTIYAPSFTINIAPGANFSVGGSFGDESGGMIIPGDGTATGTSAVVVNGPGTVTFSGTANSYTAGTTVNGGTILVSNMGASGSPISTGAVNLNGATLSLDPNVGSGTAGAISYSLATLSSTTQLAYGGGNTLVVKQGSETSFTVNIGNASPSGSVLNRVNNGTLVIAPDLGLSSLGIPGGTEFVFVTGSGPAVTNTHGIVNTSIIGQNNDSNASGEFLSYSSADGYAAYVYPTYANINTAGSSAVYDAALGTTNSVSGSPTIYALDAEGQTVDIPSGNTLSVGDNTSSHQAGVILNGGQITSSVAGGVLAFGADEGTVYTSKAGGTISANITGSGGVTAFGPGKLLLSGTNTFSGGLNINQGVVNVTTDSNLGAAGGSITFGGGTLQFASSFPTAVSRPITINAGNGTIDPQSGTLTISSSIGGAGNLTLNATGTAGELILSGANSYGGTTINTGSTLQINTGGSLGTGDVLNNGGLVFNSSGSPSVSNAISGLGSVTQSGSGTTGLSGSNSYSGATAINKGTIQAGNANALGFGGQNVGINNPVAVATVNSTGTLDLDGQVLNKPVTLNGGTLTNSSNTAGGLSSGVNGYVVTSSGSGVSADLTTVSGGGTNATVKLLLGLTNASITSVTGGTGYSTAPTVTVVPNGPGVGATAVATVSGGEVTGVTITNPGYGYVSAPTFSFGGGGGSGASVTANANNFIAEGAQALTAGSGYTSVPTVAPFGIDSSAGVLTEVLPAVTAVLNNVSVEASSTINGVGAIVLNGVNGAASSGTVTLDLDGTSTGDAINGTITDGTSGGTLALSKTNSGVWTLTGANTYTGGTTVSAGTLDVSNTSGSATGTGNVTLNGGILASDSGSISGNVIAGTGSHTIAPGGIGTIGTLSIGGLTSSSLTTLNFDLGTGSGTITNGDLLNLGAGTVNIGSGTLLTFGGTPVGNDDYRLIGGAVSGINLANFVLPSAPAGLSYSLSKADTGFIDLDVASGPVALTWDDASGNNLWDNGASVNWNNGSSNTTFSAGSAVTFNDTNGSASGRYAVTLNSTVLPSSVVVNNSSNNYSISGTGTIGGTGSLSKSGSDTLTLSTANTYSGGTSVTAGTLLIEPTSSTTSALPKGALSISGGEVQLASNVTLGSQSANVPTSAPTSNVNITSLSITGSGTLDIGNNHIIIDYSGTDPIATIAALIADGAYGSGTTVTWTGTGITSSAAAANSKSYGIGYADSADTNNPAGLSAGQIEIMYTLLGDANLDGKVNGIDFNLMATNFNQAVTDGWDKGDFNYDGKVNGIDFNLLASNFNQLASQSAGSSADVAALDAFAAANGITLTSVPEPASMGLLTLGVVGVMARRRRRSSR